MPLPEDEAVYYSTVTKPPVLPAYHPSLGIPLLLFAATLISTTLAGISYFLGFISMAGRDHSVGLLASLIGGFPYAFAIMGILLAHEMGHYLACRYYRISATYPFFIPFPFLSIAGTMGAFIRIRSAFYNARQLFDVGIAGPLLGYLFALPALVMGLASSSLVSNESTSEGSLYFGEPLIFKAVAHLLFRYDESSMSINLHPIGWAAWFGIFATSMNLLPIGQLDGGHIVYALFGPRWHRRCSIACCIGIALLSLITWSPAYVVFGILLLILGLRHPDTWEGDRIVDRGRKIWAAVALLILVLSFIPVPVSFSN